MSVTLPSTTIPLETQVGGHAGVQTSEDKSLIIKACLPKEKEFYSLLASKDILAPLRPFVPTFYGTLQLHGTVDASGSLETVNTEKLTTEKDELLSSMDKRTLLTHPATGGISSPQSIVLQNVSHTFKKPNILDIKLGTVLYDEQADAAKRERMIKTAQSTTSLETGVRLTGFQVYDPVEKVFVNTPKSYGKSITVAQLPEGMARFFPETSFSNRDLLVAVIEGIIKDVSQIKEVFQNLEIRMVGGSLLVVWEGDEEAIKKAVVSSEDEGQGGADESGQPTDDDAEGEDEDEDEDEESDANRVGPAYAVKLIDFAHTRLAPGEGPDAGIVLGLETTLRLLKGRKADLDPEDDG
ncbi:hypothetical protein FRB99_006688 [Tulasnella sp. 403]|nr:hypothetical protein FRB99_006688 [Tulasnella sp. 403]